MKLKMGVMITSVLVVSQSAVAQTFFATDFETPTYTAGDLSGQDDWMITPSGASGLVQTANVGSGLQAVELIDSASFARAQRSLTGTMAQPILEASFAMYFDDAWYANQVEDRLEAQARIEATGVHGVFGIEFGFLRAPTGGYQSLPGNTSAFYVEIGSETTMIAQQYDPVDPGAWQNSWHNYRLTYDGQSDLVKLFVDNQLKLQVVSTEDIISVSNIQLQNQRWGTSPQNNAPLYFDSVSVGAVPEPATLAGISLGLMAILRKRTQRK